MGEVMPRQPGLTLWRHIAGNTVRQEIGGDDYPPGARLPTEAELSARFAVNRHTVRRALEELSRGGLIRVEQGRGSFVTEDVLDYTGRHADSLLSSGFTGTTRNLPRRVLQRREVAADATIAAGLGIRLRVRGWYCWSVWDWRMMCRSASLAALISPTSTPAARHSWRSGGDVADYRCAEGGRRGRLCPSDHQGHRPRAHGDGGGIVADGAQPAGAGH